MIRFIHGMYLHAPTESKGIFDKPECKSQILPYVRKGQIQIEKNHFWAHALTKTSWATHHRLYHQKGAQSLQIF